MFMRTDGRQSEGWEGAMQGRETFFFPFTAWEGGPGTGELTWLLNISRTHGKFLGNFDSSEENQNAFPEL